MKVTNVFITGINGFIGSYLSSFLMENGFSVSGSVSKLSKKDEVLPGVKFLSVIALGEELSLGVLPDDIDVIIYAAHDKRNFHNNINTNKKIFELSSQKGCEQHLFISSISADNSNKTMYGQVKLELENFFNGKVGSAVIRPGLVMGAGGLYENMENYVSRNHLVPLPDGGKYKMAIIEIENLSIAVKKIIKGKMIGIYNLYDPETVSLKEIVISIAEKQNKMIFILYIPIDVSIFIFKILKKILLVLNIKNEFSSDSLSGYKLYKEIKLPLSDLKLLLKDEGNV